LDELLIDVKGYQDFCNYLVSFLDSCQAIRKFERKGIYLQGQMYLTEEYAYVLGVKKPISNRISDKDTAFMASSFDEEKKIYSQMALFHFKKRVEYYSSLMNLPYKVEVGLSKAIDYLGVNNIRKKKVLFNQALYAFNENVSDAVIVHELAHCFVQNHSKDFYAIVIKYCPNYYASQEIILSGKFNENI